MNGGEHADVQQWHVTPPKTCWKIPKKAPFKAVQMFSFNVITLLERSCVLPEFMGISQKHMHSLLAVTSFPSAIAYFCEARSMAA